jgi:DNA end-binding protein Ku
MPNRSIASLSINFGLVSIPVKLYSATHSTAAIRFKLMNSSGQRVKQQYVTDPPPEVSEQEPAQEVAPALERNQTTSLSAAPKVVNFPQRSLPLPQAHDEPPPVLEPAIERSSLLKGYEYEKGRFVLFTPEELKSLEGATRRTIDIVSFIPERAVDPIYYDKAYLLAPDKAGAKPYSLLHRAMADLGRCALAKWAFRGKEYVAQVRAPPGGLVLQQLFYADEVRPIQDLNIEMNPVGEAELSLAKQLISQISEDSYDPMQFVDEEKPRILAAVKAKIAGRPVAEPATPSKGGQVVDLLQALRASLQAPSKSPSATLQDRKPPKRAVRRPTAMGRSPKQSSRH